MRNLRYERKGCALEADLQGVSVPIDHKALPIAKPTRKRRAPKHTKKAKTRKKRGMVIDLDKVARREIVEERDQDRCQRCTAESGHYFGITGDMSRDKVVIQWAHVHTREYYITRWEPDNTLALCSRCHVWFDNHKVLSLDWFAKKFPERWERIKRMLQGNCKTTDADIRAMWQERCAGGGAPQ